MKCLQLIAETKGIYASVYSKKQRVYVLQFIQLNKWKGGLYAFWNDISIEYLLLFCSFCFLGETWKDLGLETCMFYTATLFYHV